MRTYLTDLGQLSLHRQPRNHLEEVPHELLLSLTQLANQYMGEDNAAHLVSQVLANQIEQSDVEIDGVTITSHVARDREEHDDGTRYSTREHHEDLLPA